MSKGDIKKNPQPEWLAGAPQRGGRPKGLALRIREATNGLQEQIQYLIELSSGNLDGSNKDRIEATKILLDRAYGKALEVHAVGSLSDEQRETAQELTREQLMALVTVPALPNAIGSGATAPRSLGPETGPAGSQASEDTGAED